MAELLNKKLQLVAILAFFWCFFWFLNGFDKFLNGSMEPMIESGLEKAVLVDKSGEVTSTMYGYEINGLFGSNRNAKTITFFERMGAGKTVALVSLYAVAVVEILLGAVLALGFVRYLRKNKKATACLAVGYKLSLLLFTGFCFVDILIGERIELWEHTTFILTLLISYQITLATVDLREKKPAASSLAADRTILVS